MLSTPGSENVREASVTAADYCDVSIEKTVLASIKKWLKSPSGISLLSTLIIGLIVHLYIYTNIYFGHDASEIMNYSPGWDIVTGRFVGTFIKQIHNSLQLPFLIGIISLVLLGFSSVLICKMLEIEKTIFIIATSALIVSWPTIIGNNCYYYMAGQFCMAIFASILAAFVTDRFKLGYLASIPIIVISMACYQSYWGTAATLLLICLIRDILGNYKKTSLIILHGIKSLIMLVTGFAIYYLLWNYILSVNSLEATAYRGMDSMGYASVEEFFVYLKGTYYTVAKFFLKQNFMSYYPVYLMVAVWVGLAFALGLIFNIIIKCKLYKQSIKLILLILMVFLMPIAMNCVELFSKGTTQNVLSQFAFLAPLLVLIMLISKTDGDPGLIKDVRLKITAFGVSILVFLLCFANGLYGANITYVKLEINYDNALSYVTQCLSRIHAEEGYNTDTPVAIVGQPKTFGKTGFEWTRDISGASDTALTYTGPINAFFRRLDPGVNLVYDSSPYLEAANVMSLEAFPNNNCITWVEGTLIVKLSQ